VLSPGRRRGFTLVEVLVVLAIGVILAAAFLPAIIGRLDQTRVDESAKSLAGVVEAMRAMHADVGRDPGRLSQLTTPITTGQQDVCGAFYTAAEAAAWAGPYLNRPLSTTGLPLPIGLARDLLVNTPPPPGTLLHIIVQGVSHEDALALSRKVDGNEDPASGVVRWGGVTDGVVELSYVRPIRPC
jgi:prepilin-type N-terminal cleavage/methylation domain-containing protein